MTHSCYYSEKQRERIGCENCPFAKDCDDPKKDSKTLKLIRKGDICTLEIQIKASNPELRDQTAESIRKYLTTQREWSEIGSTGR